MNRHNKAEVIDWASNLIHEFMVYNRDVGFEEAEGYLIQALFDTCEAGDMVLELMEKAKLGGEEET